MKHVHKFETLLHHDIRSELMEFGLQAAEIRKCSKCRKEMTFLQTKKGEWLPLFDERSSDERDILLA